MDLNKLLKKIGFDRVIGYTVLARIVQAFGSLFNIYLISIYLDKELQGYYYTFGSLIAIQIFFELGLSTIIVQFVAHESVHLKLEANKLYGGSDLHLSRLSSFLRFTLKIFAFLSFVLFTVLIFLGNYFFDKFSMGNSEDLWRMPWLLLCFSTSLLLFLNPIIGFIQGLGYILEVSKVTVFQQFLVLMTTSFVLYSGGGLFALGFSNLISGLFILFFLVFSKYKNLLISIWRGLSHWSINYLNEVFPYQWKLALSWISGYFIFQLFNPVLFATEGVVIAGKMGMTLAIINGVSGLAMSWISTKIPLFSTLISLKKFEESNVIFKKTLLNVIGVSVFLFFILICGIQILNFIYPKLGSRFLKLDYIIVLSIISLINLVIYCWASYLRCFKNEPYLINSLVIGLLCGISTIVLGNIFGLIGIVGGYTFISIFISLPWSYKIFIHYRYNWQLR